MRPTGVITCPRCKRHTVFDITENEKPHHHIFRCQRCQIQYGIKIPAFVFYDRLDRTLKESFQSIGVVLSSTGWKWTRIGTTPRVNGHGRKVPVDSIDPKPPKWLRRWRIH